MINDLFCNKLPQTFLVTFTTTFPVTFSSTISVTFPVTFATVFPLTFGMVSPMTFATTFPMTFATVFPLTFGMVSPMTFATTFPMTFATTFPMTFATVFPLTFGMVSPMTLATTFPMTFATVFPLTFDFADPTIDLENTTVKEGENLTVRCNVSGVPQPSVRWLLEGLKSNYSVQALIVAKVGEEEAFRQKLASSAARRRQRKQPIGTRTEPPSPVPSGEGSAASPASEGGDWVLDASEGELYHKTNPGLVVEQEEEAVSEKDSELGNHSDQVSKFEVPSPDFSFLADEHLEVYISASENPSHFWIQILGSRCLQLDNLTYEMSRYYSGFSATGEVFTPKLGDIVAAPFQGDNAWYRARVVGFLETGNADLYYVDYGDNGEIPIGKLQILRSDFLSLPFQAVECSLDGVQPAGEEWSDEAMNCFDSLTYCAEWKSLLARICSYSQSGGVTRPQVKLFDRTHDKNLDIGEELIRLGHAVRCYQTVGAAAGDCLETAGKSTTTSLQTLLNDVAGGLDGRLLSELCTRSGEEQFSTCWQTHSGV
ncbi:tudor and KH domain-containing protein-like [Carcharodon carcharias]|uniref:tudor and KH domain-containing protein-like n=1 Tax=Carcharodon carcharias TaxID=13397 RepID=UPI001B7E9B62|nr:tudor and KH domain-containing protein-like [Carcharodon carcharias]